MKSVNQKVSALLEKLFVCNEIAHLSLEIVLDHLFGLPELVRVGKKKNEMSFYYDFDEFCGNIVIHETRDRWKRPKCFWWHTRTCYHLEATIPIVETQAQVTYSFNGYYHHVNEITAHALNEIFRRYNPSSLSLNQAEILNAAIN